MSIATDDPDFVTSFARGLDVIACFGPSADRMTLSEVAHKTHLARGTARRLLLTLEALGYVRSDGKTFSLTPRILNLGYAYLSSLPLWSRAQLIMSDVVAMLDQSCSLGALEGQDIVYLARIPPKHLFYLPVTPGTRMPAHINAMGQVLLAELNEPELDLYFRNARFEKLTKYTMTKEAEIRKGLKRAARDRFAISDRQYHPTICSIAVSVPSNSGRSEIAINASAEHSQASKDDLVKKFLPVLRRAAAQLAGVV